MKFKEIAKRITGLSSPIFGVSWNLPESELAIARRVISFLEDRRVLYNPTEMELPDHCVQSVIQIRGRLTEEIGELENDSSLLSSIRAMRAACRKFLDSVGSDEKIIKYGAHHGHCASWQFNGSVGELRGVFGIHLAQIAAAYRLDIKDDLSTILPAADNEKGT